MNILRAGLDRRIGKIMLYGPARHKRSGALNAGVLVYPPMDKPLFCEESGKTSPANL
jgi:hypothetical protein